MKEITFDNLRSLWDSTTERQRRIRVAGLLQMYSGDWTSQLDAEIKKVFMPQNYEKLRLRADTSFNILKWAVDTLGAVYAKPVLRELDSDPEPWDAFRDLDLALDQAARLLFLCREIFVRPIVYADGSVIMDIMTPENVLVIPSETDPWGMKAVLYSIGGGARFVLWTSESHYILGEDFLPIMQEENPDNVNPYGTIPWLCFHARYPAGGAFFNDLDTEGLRQANLSAALAKTDYNHLRHVQSFKQLVFTGVSDESAVRAMIDPATALQVKNPNAKVQVLDMQANLKDHLDTIIATGAATLNLMGIKPDMVKGSMTAQSGYALQIMMHDTERAWDQQRQLWRVYENMIYELTSIVVEADTGAAMPSGNINITFGDLRPASNPTEQAAYFSSLVENGLMSKKQAMMMLFEYNENEVQNEFDEMSKEVRLSTAMVTPIEDASKGLDVGGFIADSDTGEGVMIGEQMPQEQKAADTALNGAQVAAAVEIVERVALGTLPRATGVNMLITFFQLSFESANEIMGTVGASFTPTKEEDNVSA